MSITSHSSSMSSGLASIDLTQEMLDEESREKLKGKQKQLENKLKKEREFHRTILVNYEDETVWDMEETRCRMHVYCNKQKIQQCKILLAHTGSIQTLKAVPPSLTSSSCATPGSISLKDSAGASAAGIQGGSSSAMVKKRQVGNVKLVPRSTSNKPQEQRMTLPSQVYSPFPVWLYHSSWSDDLSLLHIIPPFHLMVINFSWI